MLNATDAKIAKALKLADDTVEEARRQLDRLQEEAEGLGLDISNEVSDAVADLMLSMSRFVDAVKDGLDFMDAGEHVAGIAGRDGDEGESHPIH